jgi:hypothetical protein
MCTSDFRLSINNVNLKIQSQIAFELLYSLLPCLNMAGATAFYTIERIKTTLQLPNQR